MGSFDDSDRHEHLFPLDPGEASVRPCFSDRPFLLGGSCQSLEASESN